MFFLSLPQCFLFYRRKNTILAIMNLSSASSLKLEKKMLYGNCNDYNDDRKHCEKRAEIV